MSRSTGPILATGAISLVNGTILGDPGPPDWNNAAKIIVATGLVAGTTSLIERVMPDLAVAMAWAAFVAMMFTRIDPKVPSPTERVISWWEKASK